MMARKVFNCLLYSSCPGDDILLLSGVPLTHIVI